MKYRPEIDGLRAISVISVILFHARCQYFRGGFVGVDVFFVISGYLITTIILTEKDQGTFSLLNFYERRIRRIFPALFLVTFASLIFAWFWLPTWDMKDFSHSLIAVSIFASNIFFWRETGYWETDSELKPLLHTWSLAIEEQYYLLFPLFLLLMWRFRKRWIFTGLILVAIASLGISQWEAFHHPSANFFILPTRAWELVIGAILAVFILYGKSKFTALFDRRPVCESLNVIGLLLIGYSIYTFNQATPFPSVYALIPTIGAGLIILFCSSETLVGQLLGTRILVGIGLISYSLYLWHQPVFAFARHRSLSEPNNLLLLGLTVLLVPLAYLSWRYVEQPFRKSSVIGTKTVTSLAVAGLLLFASVGWAGDITDGFSVQITHRGPSNQAIANNQKPSSGLSDVCDNSFTLSPECRTSDEPEIVVWGDSFAMHLLPAIMASNPNAKIIQMTKSLCSPFFDVATVDPPDQTVSWSEGCLEFSGKVRDWLKTNDTVKYAVLSSPLDNRFLSENSTLLSRNREILNAGFQRALDELDSTLSELEAMEITPVVFSPPASNGDDLGRCLAQANWMGVNLDQCDFPLDEMRFSRLRAYDFLDIIQEHHRVVRLDKLTCESSQCKTHLGSALLYRDAGHLSYEGAVELGKKYDFYKMIVEDSSA